MRSLLEIFLIVIPAIVEARDIRDSGKFGGHDILRYPELVAMLDDASGSCRIHGHSGGARRVEALDKHIHHAVGRDAPVAGRESAPLFLKLKLVAEAPHYHRRMVTVALDPLDDILIPYIGPGLVSGPCHGVAPFVIELVDYQQSFLVGKTQEIL